MAKKQIRSRGRGRSLRLLALTLFLLGGVFSFLHAASFLIAQDPFAHAEIGLVLSGQPLARCLAAGELYRDGKINEILVIPEPTNPLREKLIELRVAQSDSIAETRHLLTALHVPPSQITILPEPAEGTIREALLVHRFFKNKKNFPATLVLITSPSASQRARFIFRWVFRVDPIKILSSPSPYDPFQTSRWWSKPRNALSVVEEYQKFLANIMMLLCGAGKEAG